MSDAGKFGRYLLRERLAVGGMAEVYLAQAVGPMGFAKDLVIKRILPQFSRDAEFVRMFVTEAKLVSHLVHPNIVQVYELGEIDGQYYMAMEQVPGLDLRRIWIALADRKQRLPTALSLHIASEFLKGLDYAHRAVGPDGAPLGVVHRDVSPSNILVAWRGDIRITDFGIALVQTEVRGSARQFMGKHEYMAPEQLTRQTVDHRSDIFSAGVVLAELLLGRRLFSGKTDLERMERVARADISVFNRHADAFPAPVVGAVRSALRADPAQRYQSARDFQRVLAEQLHLNEVSVDSEAVASFIAQHVVPQLDRQGHGGPSGQTGPTGTGSVSPPVVPHGIVPDDAELTPPPYDPEDGSDDCS